MQLEAPNTCRFPHLGEAASPGLLRPHAEAGISGCGVGGTALAECAWGLSECCGAPLPWFLRVPGTLPVVCSDFPTRGSFAFIFPVTRDSRALSL